MTNSFFRGIRNSASSRLAYNDWRLKNYMSDRFPEIPRQELTPSALSASAGIVSEPLEMGEIAECKLQKSEWSRCVHSYQQFMINMFISTIYDRNVCRCRVIFVRTLKMYDIRYDSGEDVRFVREDQLRLPPEKR